jgi:two-component system, NarL family, sensor kinase
VPAQMDSRLHGKDDGVLRNISYLPNPKCCINVMNPRFKLFVFAVAPLLVAVVVIGALLLVETQRLEKQQSQVLEALFFNAKREELRNYVALAQTSIDHLYGKGRDDAAAKAEAKAILASVNFGSDGYFFVYDMQGQSLVHPRQQELVGTNLWDMRDPSGTFVIRELVARANEGGGFVRYFWPKPSNAQVTEKLGYAVALKRWGWVLGTGIYIDDVNEAVLRMRGNMLQSVRQTLVGLGGVAVLAMLMVFGGGLALNISEQRVADRKLKALAHRVVTSQEDERARVSRELHDHICQLLVSIKYQFELVAHRLVHPGAQPVKAIDKEIKALSQAITEVRRISHGLRPALLDNLGLPSALVQIGNELAERTGLAVQVFTDQVKQHLPEFQAVTLFRVTQEALRNVELHAQASQVEIRLDESSGYIRLQITDNGLGFQVQQLELSKDRGIGLSNMRERVERNEGSFSIISRPGHTVVTAAFPEPLTDDEALT